MPRRHRLEVDYPRVWRAVDGALRSAMAAHPDIVIPNTDSVVKRIVGQVLAHEVRAAIAVETARAGRTARGVDTPTRHQTGRAPTRPVTPNASDDPRRTLVGPSDASHYDAP